MLQEYITAHIDNAVAITAMGILFIKNCYILLSTINNPKVPCVFQLSNITIISFLLRFYNFY